MENEEKTIDDAVKGIDLTPVLNDLAKADETEAVKEQATTRDDKGRFVPKEKLTDQFKTEEDRIKGYKELQGFATKVSQENKALKEQMLAIQEQQEIARLAASATPFTTRRQEDMTQEEDIDQRIHMTVATQRIAEILEEESDKNPREFQERYAYAQMIARDPQYAALARTPKGVRKLFEKGDKLRAESLKKNAGKALETIFGEPLGEQEIARLKSLVKGETHSSKTINSDAYMPDTSTSTKTGADQKRKPNLDQTINESVEKGDVDGVISGIFSRILAE